MAAVAAVAGCRCHHFTYRVTELHADSRLYTMLICDVWHGTSPHDHNPHDRFPFLGNNYTFISILENFLSHTHTLISHAHTCTRKIGRSRHLYYTYTPTGSHMPFAKYSEVVCMEWGIEYISLHCVLLPYHLISSWHVATFIVSFHV